MSSAPRPSDPARFELHAIALPRSVLGWDVFCWIGHRRFARHWSIPQIRAELWDSHRIGLSEDAIEDAARNYECQLAARQQDPQVLAEEYAGVDELRLTIDGLQPEKGHETLYVVRELTLKRVWFAEALVSSSADEVRRLIAEARVWVERLGTTSLTFGMRVLPRPEREAMYAIYGFCRMVDDIADDQQGDDVEREGQRP